MSDALYPVRLRFDRNVGIGVARCDGVQVEITWPPAIPGLESAAEIDFIPHVIAQVRIGSERIRDMTDNEKRDALAILQAMAHQARDAIEGGSTIVVVVR
jgi:hypothetical protein